MSLRSHAIAGLMLTGLVAGACVPVIGQTHASRWREDLGTAFALSGDDAQAAMQFRKSLELTPSNLDAMDALDALHKKSGTGR